MSPGSAVWPTSTSPRLRAIETGDAMLRRTGSGVTAGGLGGRGYRATLEEAVPGAFDAAVANADLFFQVEMPALRLWPFGEDEARRITCPVLNVRGTDSAPRFVAASDLVQTWFPDAESFPVADTGHFLMVEQLKAIALGLTEFVGRPHSSTS